jgi:acetyltransferase-like isoleucine patch superfamily enzyme
LAETAVQKKLQPAHRPGRFRLVCLACVALLPSFLKRPIYRLCFGYKIGKRVRIGLSLLDARICVLQDDVTVGHLNLILGVGELHAGDHVRIGHCNILRGGDRIELGRYSEIVRFNVVNSIVEPELDPNSMLSADPRFLLGAGSVVVAGHKIDFTDRVEIGKRTILGGRNSSIWTHNRQRTQPVRIGSFAYIGSEIRISPGGAIPSRCIVGIGSVIVGQLERENQLFAGVPAKAIKPLDEQDVFLIEYKTRADLPENL